MDAPRSEPGGSRFDELHAEAAEALAYAANSVRSVRDRYRGTYLEEMARWQVISDDLDGFEGVPASVDGTGDGGSDALAASAAEAGAADLRLRFMRGEADHARVEMARHESELGRLELVIRNLESTWLFLERGDDSLVMDPGLPSVGTELQMRIVEAQEAERSRLAQEVHDGPAQALSNAIFQVEYIDRIFESEPALARVELGFLRGLLRRELGDVRSFIVQLRPPVLVELGLDGSLRDAVETQTALSGLVINTDLAAPSDGLSEAEQTVVLRIAQEALQNVRKHAGATNVLVATRLDGTDWVLEIRDDGRGFDTGAVAARGRRNFGLQFMRERAELIGARFEVQSRPEAGTVVRLAIPLPRKENG
ncbi:MAG: sensor histidine kinase [Candidatus Limnocylindrales bacterium]